MHKPNVMGWCCAPLVFYFVLLASKTAAQAQTPLPVIPLPAFAVLGRRSLLVLQRRAREHGNPGFTGKHQLHYLPMPSPRVPHPSQHLAKGWMYTARTAMPTGLKRSQQTGNFHFVTLSC